MAVSTSTLKFNIMDHTGHLLEGSLVTVDWPTKSAFSRYTPGRWWTVLVFRLFWCVMLMKHLRLIIVSETSWNFTFWREPSQECPNYIFSCCQRKFLNVFHTLPATYNSWHFPRHFWYEFIRTQTKSQVVESSKSWTDCCFSIVALK